MKYHVLIDTPRWKGAVPIEADGEEDLMRKARAMQEQVERDFAVVDEAERGET